MGIASSPWFGMHAMRLTFHKDAYLTWKQNLPSDTKFPFVDPAQFLVFYMDDILVASPEVDGFDLHLLCLDFVFYALELANLRLNVKKSNFLTSQIQF